MNYAKESYLFDWDSIITIGDKNTFILTEFCEQLSDVYWMRIVETEMVQTGESENIPYPDRKQAYHDLISYHPEKEKFNKEKIPVLNEIQLIEKANELNYHKFSSSYHLKSCWRTLLKHVFICKAIECLKMLQKMRETLL